MTRRTPAPLQCAASTACLDSVVTAGLPEALQDVSIVQYLACSEGCAVLIRVSLLSFTVTQIQSGHDCILNCCFGLLLFICHVNGARCSSSSEEVRC